ncbi:type I restriction enzyme HsdR N-terminal domain-containing protein [Bacteroidota bacterium]
MQKLNLPVYDLSIDVRDGGKQYVFDPFRRKYLVLTPEEHVRQIFSRYLIEEKEYPLGYLMTEYSLKVNRMSKRCDIIIFNKDRSYLALVECKAPDVKISQEVFDQVARYNLAFKVSYMMVTNGLEHYCCMIDFQTRSVSFLNEIPAYPSIT